jgi:predicted esterase
MRLCRSLSFIAVLLLIAPGAWAKPSCGKGGATGEGSGKVSGGTFLYNVPGGYNPKKAMPLLFVLHGDEGTPNYIYSVFKKMQTSSNGAFIMFAPKAPAGGGSWYQAKATHTTFIDQLTAKVLKEYNIDQDRMWITGWSGGSYFLANYAIDRQNVWAAVVYNMGTMFNYSYAPPAGSCKIPARFVTGSLDFSHVKSAKKLHDQLKDKGHEVVWVIQQGVGHKLDQNQLPTIWSWLQGKTLCDTTIPGTCDGSPPPKPPPPPAPDAGTPPQPGAPDGGPPPLTPQQGSYGATCSLSSDCTSGMCAQVPGDPTRYCTQGCDPSSNPCPGGATCELASTNAYACGPPPNLNRRPESGLIGDAELIGGCQVGGGEAAGGGVTLLLLLVLWCARRWRSRVWTRN